MVVKYICIYIYIVDMCTKEVSKYTVTFLVKITNSNVMSTMHGFHCYLKG